MTGYVCHTLLVHVANCWRNRLHNNQRAGVPIPMLLHTQYTLASTYAF